MHVSLLLNYYLVNWGFVYCCFIFILTSFPASPHTRKKKTDCFSLQATESWVGLGNKASFILYVRLAFPLIVNMSMYNLGTILKLHIWTCMSHVIVNLYKCSKCIVPFLHSRSRPKQQQSTSLSVLFTGLTHLQFYSTASNKDSGKWNGAPYGIPWNSPSSLSTLWTVCFVGFRTKQEKFEHNSNLLYSCVSIKSRKVKAKSYLSICRFLLGQICLLKWKVVFVFWGYVSSRHH